MSWDDCTSCRASRSTAMDCSGCKEYRSNMDSLPKTDSILENKEKYIAVTLKYKDRATNQTEIKIRQMSDRLYSLSLNALNEEDDEWDTVSMVVNKHDLEAIAHQLLAIVDELE